MKNMYTIRTALFSLPLVLALCSNRCSLFTTLTAQAGGFQAPFDFDKFLNELESALAEIEQEEKAAPSKPKPDWQAPIQPLKKSEPATGAAVVEKPEDVARKKDPESLFKDPILQKVTAKGGKQEQTIPSKESLAAYSTIMTDFVHHLTSLEKKLSSIKTVSPEFKEEARSFIPIMNAIVIAHQQIESKKSYKQLFLAPPEANKQLVSDMKQLRTMITNIAKNIKKMDENLVIRPETEEEEEEEDILLKLAKKAKKQESEAPTDEKKEEDDDASGDSNVKAEDEGDDEKESDED